MAAAFCSQCGTALRAEDRFCSQCGYNVLGNSVSAPVQQDGRQSLSGPNKINFWQNATESHFEAAFTDNTATQLADVVQTLVGNKIIHPIVRTLSASDGIQRAISGQAVQDEGFIESTLEAPPTLESPAETLSSHTPADEATAEEVVSDIAHVFVLVHDQIRLRQPVLKAKNATDYSIRASRLFLYYMQHQKGVVAVPKADVYGFLRSMSLKQTDFRPAISKDPYIDYADKTKTSFELNYAGEQAAKRHLEDIANPELDDGWYPGKEEKASASRKRTTRRRNTEGNEAEAPTTVEWKPEVRQLQEIIRSHHQDVVQWQTSNTVLLGLHAIRKQYGDDHETSYRSLAGFLYSAFELSVKEDSIRRALDRLRDSDKKYINPGRNRGYRISPSGIQYVDNELLPSLGQTEPQSGLFGTDADSEAVS